MIKRTHNCGSLRIKDVGKEVVLSGWVNVRRDHGGLIFVDLRDREGITQVVFNPQVDTDSHLSAHQLRSEYVIAVRGVVEPRPKGTVNLKLPTGKIEVLAYGLEVINPSKTPPFEIREDIDVAEDLRLRYRYLDLRRPGMQRNLLLRHRLSQKTREFLDRHGFLEIETPFLIKSTPEGARDYLVPSRVNPGKFYALPQSPQLFKQILMVAGLERYFQIVRCFRDEDLRADRQPEFTQIDIEASFIDEEDVYKIIEGLMVCLFREVVGVEIPVPFERLTYKEAMAKFGKETPDTRFGLEIVDLTEIVKGSEFQVFRTVIERGGRVKGIRAPSLGGISRSEIEDLTSIVSLYGAKGLAYFKVKDGRCDSPIAKFFKEDIKQEILSSLKAEENDLLLFVADNEKVAAESLGNLRLHLAERLGLIPKEGFKFLWVTHYPLVEYDDKEKRFQALHHPFTSPILEDIGNLSKDPLKVRARSYDLVLNGVEIGGGSIRIHQEEIQREVFKLLGIGDREAEERFGFLLEAFTYGAPPHGGIALGLDRLLRIMLGCESIREVIAFPKTQTATCLMTGAPFEVDKRQLKELNIRLEE